MATSLQKPAWLWIPALWALAFDWSGGNVYFMPRFLAIPIAAYLGHHYSRRALWLVAIGGLSLLSPVSYGLKATT